jgi:hypothetical protein
VKRIIISIDPEGHSTVRTERDGKSYPASVVVGKNSTVLSVDTSSDCRVGRDGKNYPPTARPLNCRSDRFTADAADTGTAAGHRRALPRARDDRTRRPRADAHVIRHLSRRPRRATAGHAPRIASGGMRRARETEPA